MKDKTTLKFIAWTFIIAWSCWFALIFLTKHQLTKFGNLLFMSLYLAGGLCPSIAAIIATRKDRPFRSVLKAGTIKYKVNLSWYTGIIAVPVLISGFSWLFNSICFGRSGPFLQNSIWAGMLILPVMIIGGGSEEVGWRGVLLPKLLQSMSPLKATIAVASIWGIWHAPLWFLEGVPQYGSNFIFFICGTFSMSFLLTIIYVRTRSIFVCILFHAVANAYLYIGLDSWPRDMRGSIIIALPALIFSIILFRFFISNTSPLGNVHT